MKLSELLVPEQVVLPLVAADKWQAIERMAEVAVAAGRLPPRLLDPVHAALKLREQSMTTGMEQGIAIPHAAVEGIEQVIAVLAIAPDGIPFQALDNRPARILVCLIIPRHKKLLHIKTLAEIARLLSRAAVRESLLTCTTPEQVLGAIRTAEAA
jgi:mannitol/fructose-specific phosphotransferase system IIA component (Ntr-type)